MVIKAKISHYPISKFLTLYLTINEYTILSSLYTVYSILVVQYITMAWVSYTMPGHYERENSSVRFPLYY